MSKPSSSVIALTQERVSFVFGSKYIFHRPEDLIGQFTSEEIECVYNDDLGARISEKEPFFEEKFDWENLLEELERPSEDPKSPDDFNLEAGPEEPPSLPLIEHEAFVKSFQRRGLADTPMFQLYSPNTLHDIQITTNCRIEIDDVSGTISVIGDDEADTYRAISKLSNLEKIDADRKSRSWKSNFYLSKHKAIWRFGLLRDDLLIDRAFLNTGRTFYRILKMPYVETLNLYKVQTFARQKIVYDWEISRFWIDYEYPAFGKSENSPANWVTSSRVSAADPSVADRPKLPPGKVGTVKEWLPKASAAQADPFKPTTEDEQKCHDQSPQDLQKYLTTIRSVEGSKEEAIAPTERVLLEASHSSTLKPITEETDDPRSPTATDLSEDQSRKVEVPLGGDLLLPEEDHNVTAESNSNVVAPTEVQQPFINDEWPSPETAMAIPENSWSRDRRSKKKSKGKGRGRAQGAASTTATQIPVQPPAPLASVDPPIGPAARFAAEFHARRAAQSKPPPPIEAPYMPPKDTTSPAPNWPSRRRTTHGTSHHKHGGNLQSSTGKSSSGTDNAVQRFIDRVVESDRRGKLASRGAEMAKVQPKFHLNPLAPAWEPWKTSPVMDFEPLPPPLLPIPVRQPFFNVESMAKTSTHLMTDEALPNRNVGERSSTIPINIEEFLISLDDAEEPLVDLSDHDESRSSNDDERVQHHIGERGIAALDLAVPSSNNIPGSVNIRQRLDPSALPFIPAPNTLTVIDNAAQAHATSQTSSLLLAASQPGLSELGDLLEFNSTESELEETREPIAEIESRSFQEGALLLAPSVPQGTFIQIGPAVAHDQIMIAAIEALDMLRAARGYITLHLDIGHLLLPEIPFHKYPYRDGFPPDEWKTLMDPSRPWSMGRNLVFSKVLTPNWFDAEWMCDCPDATGTRLFDESSRQERVFYEIKCHNRSNEAEYVITLETDGSYEILTALKLEAEINVLFADHNWDTQLIAQSQEKPTLLDNHNLMSIIDNMYIPGGTKLPELYTRCNNNFIEIISILVKRRYSYEASACSDFALQMTEVIDLPIEKSLYHQQYRAVAIEEDLVKHHRRWYEASIISTAAQSILTENLNLEVGEYTKWTTARLKQAGFIQDLLAIASGLIANSDAVGCPTAGFLPEADPARKAAAAAEARQRRGLNGNLAGSRLSPTRSSRPHIQAPVTIVPPNGQLPPTPQGVPAAQEAREEGPDLLSPKEEEPVEEWTKEGGQQRPSGFW